MNILWLKTELLHPVDKGGKIRTYAMLRELKRHHRITYLTLDSGASDQAVERANEYCHELVRIPHSIPEKFSARFYADLMRNTASSLPYALRAYRSEPMRRAIEERIAEGEVDLVVCDFLTPSINLPSAPGVPSLLFQHNVEAMIWQRHTQVQRNPLKKAFLWWEWQKMRAAEARECARYDHVVAVSTQDAGVLKAQYGLRAVSDIPTGVDVEFFSPSKDVESEPHEVVFTGSMDWLPNQDAVEFFMSDVFPRLVRALPTVHFTVVGRNPPSALVERAKVDPRLSVTGFVDDVRPYVDRASVFVVPIRIGGGTRLKIYEAMAMGKPVVSTEVGAEGLPLRAGKDIVIADDPEAFAGEVERLLSDREGAEAFGVRAAAIVRETFAWKAVSERFSEICEQTVVDFRRDNETNVEVISNG